MSKQGFTLIELMLVVAAIVLLTAIFIPIYQKWSDPEGYAKWQAEQDAREYNRNFPCINSVRYIKSYGKSESLTPMIDPKTMQPQLCGPEAQ